jgi:hypothetical protein
VLRLLLLLLLRLLREGDDEGMTTDYSEVFCSLLETSL